MILLMNVSLSLTSILQGISNNNGTLPSRFIIIIHYCFAMVAYVIQSYAVCTAAAVLVLVGIHIKLLTRRHHSDAPTLGGTNDNDSPNLWGYCMQILQFSEN